MLFKPWIVRSEVEVQTDPVPEKPKARSPTASEIADADENQLDLDSDGEDIRFVDQFKEDWSDSIVFKKAMKAEAIKRGLPYDEYDQDDDERAFDNTLMEQENLTF